MPVVELERLGPLSYDVTVPDRDPSAQRGIIRGLLTVIAGWLVGQILGWFTLGWVTDRRIVSRGFPLAILLLTLLAGLSGLRRSTPRAVRNGLLTVGAIGTVGALLAMMTLSNIKPTMKQVRHELDRVAFPAGYRVVAEETKGDRLCRQGCPTIERVYAAPESDPDPVRTMVLALFAQGWERTSDVEPENATTARRGSIFVHLGETAPHTVELTATRQS